MFRLFSLNTVFHFSVYFIYNICNINISDADFLYAAFHKKEKTKRKQSALYKENEKNLRKKDIRHGIDNKNIYELLVVFESTMHEYTTYAR